MELHKQAARLWWMTIGLVACVLVVGDAKYLSFDGATTHVEVPSLGVSPAGTFTIEAWVKPTIFSGFRSILNAESWKKGDVHLQFVGNKLEFALHSDSPADQRFTRTFATNTWVHLALAYDKTTKSVTLYVNGKFAQRLLYTTAIDRNFGPSTIGSWDHTRFFKGLITEVRIWNHARSAGQIETFYLERVGGNEAGLIACWPLNEGKHHDARELVRGKDGDIFGLAIWVDDAGPGFRQLLSFDGTDMVSVPVLTKVSMDSLTIETWFKSASLASASTIRSDNPLTKGNVHLQLGNYKLLFGVIGANPPYQTFAHIFRTNEWAHVAVVYSKFGKWAKLYVDGVYTEKLMYTSAISVQLAASTIGSYGKTNGFKGIISEFRIWQYPRSQDDIKSTLDKRLTGQEGGLLGYWPLNDGTGKVARDLTPNAKNGAVSGATWVDQKGPDYTKLLYVDGKSGRVSVPSLQVAPVGVFTIETWIKPNSISGWRAIRNEVTWSTGDIHLQLINGKLMFAFKGCNPTDQVFSVTFKSNQWVHLAIVYSKSGKLVKFYVNGQYVQQKTYTSTVNARFAASTIGSWGSSRYFQGIISEFRIWKYARSATQIMSMHDKRIGGYEPQLLAYWPLNEGVGNLAYETVNGKAGVLSGAYKWVDGQDPGFTNVLHFMNDIVIRTNTVFTKMYNHLSEASATMSSVAASTTESGLGLVVCGCVVVVAVVYVRTRERKKRSQFVKLNPTQSSKLLSTQ